MPQTDKRRSVIVRQVIRRLLDRRMLDAWTVAFLAREFRLPLARVRQLLIEETRRATA
jgi:hypothetical protein